MFSAKALYCFSLFKKMFLKYSSLLQLYKARKPFRRCMKTNSNQLPKFTTLKFADHRTEWQWHVGHNCLYIEMQRWQTRKTVRDTCHRKLHDVADLNCHPAYCNGRIKRNSLFSMSTAKRHVIGATQANECRRVAFLFASWGLFCGFVATFDLFKALFGPNRFLKRGAFN